MNPSSPWVRLVAGLLAAAIAIRIVVQLLEPVLPFVVGVFVFVGLLRIFRWWRDRW